ncbi:unnamed protein product [Auanema sp. JU1783]|nr:unnamed protein product [Auanema sp. JU1783]
MNRLFKCLPSTSSMRALSSIEAQKALPEHMKVFDRNAKRRQRDWSFTHKDFEAAQYLKEEVGWRVADKVFDLTKFNELALDIGCGIGHIAPHMIKENIGKLIQCDMSQVLVENSKGCDDDEVVIERVHCDEELLEPFHKEQFDLLLSSLSAHWINDLPGWFQRCFEILKPDGAFIGTMLAEDTLYELRCSLQLAEIERVGGVGSHISPFVKAQDIGGLLGKAGFDMITLDTDEIEVGYPNMFALLYDLQLMGESNCTYRRSPSVRRDVLLAADCIYKAMYAKDEKYPATFRLVSYIGWKPGPLMPKPAKRGSQNVSLKDIGKLVENPELLKKLSDTKEGKEKK